MDSLLYPHFEEEGGGVYCVSSVRSFRLSVLASVTNISRRTFLSNHALQPLQTWYGTSDRGPKRRLSNSGPPLIYFLFDDLVYFPTSYLLPVSRLGSFVDSASWDSGGILSEKSSQISCYLIFFLV